MKDFTNGPWRSDRQAVLAKGKIADLLIATVHKTYSEPEEAEANARLIAAAPDLLEACKVAETCFRKMEKNIGPETYFPAVSILRWAIDRAEGGNH